MEKCWYGDQARMYYLKVKIRLFLSLSLFLSQYLSISVCQTQYSSHSLSVSLSSFSRSVSPSLSPYLSSFFIIFSFYLPPLSLSFLFSPSFPLPFLELDKLDVLQTCYNNPASWNIRQGTFGADSIGSIDMSCCLVLKYSIIYPCSFLYFLSVLFLFLFHLHFSIIYCFVSQALSLLEVIWTTYLHCANRTITAWW